MIEILPEAHYQAMEMSTGEDNKLDNLSYLSSWQILQTMRVAFNFSMKKKKKNHNKDSFFQINT